MRPDHNFQNADQEDNDSIGVVVADTSPLNYLVLIDCHFLLPHLFGRIIAPPSVVTELTRDISPPPVASWASQRPGWLEVLAPAASPDARLCRLDPGERDAIQLALELRASAVLIDERKGRKEAENRGLPIIGTLGVLLQGGKAGLVDGFEALDRLTQVTTFRITSQLRQNYLAALNSRIGKF